MHDVKTLTNTIGNRLIEERKRLRLKQSEFADAAGVSRTTMSLYGTGKFQPGSAVWAKLHAAGVDIIYVLTGERQQMQEVHVPQIGASREIDLDLDRMTKAIAEARRQLDLPLEATDQRAVLERAWVIYQAIPSFSGLIEKTMLQPTCQPEH